jgi:hypothetical protein
MLGSFSSTVAEAALDEWRSLWQSLVVQFIDGMVTVADPHGARQTGATKQSVPYGEDWYARVVSDPKWAAHYRCGGGCSFDEDEHNGTSTNRAAISKLAILMR